MRWLTLFDALIAAIATALCAELLITGHTNIFGAIAVTAWVVPAAWGRVFKHDA